MSWLAAIIVLYVLLQNEALSQLIEAGDSHICVVPTSGAMYC
jgi:hypothetical protein